MTIRHIDNLCRPGALPAEPGVPQLIETHISWVLVGEYFVYKFKKPIRYSFLDFSSPEKRRYYCEREVMLNKRLTTGIYLGVVPVWLSPQGWTFKNLGGPPCDFAVRMRKMDPARRMDLLVSAGGLTAADVEVLAARIAGFHRCAPAIRDTNKDDSFAMRGLFNDLGREKGFLREKLGSWAGDLIDESIEYSNHYLQENAQLLSSRRAEGLYRDGHGDLHCRNIFLLDQPQVFDCIEFNDELRQVDVLNDVAFLCMDLDHLGREDLAALFMSRYLRNLPEAMSAGQEHLINYYKLYRANIRAKINSLRARNAPTSSETRSSLDTAVAYLRLMTRYRATVTYDA